MNTELSVYSAFEPGVEKVSDHRTIGPRKILSSQKNFEFPENILQERIKL